MPLGEIHLWAGVYSNPDTYCSVLEGQEMNHATESMNFGFENAQSKRKHKYVNEQI